MKRINRNDLFDFFSQLNKATFVSIKIVTEPKMVQKHRETKELNPYYGKVEKWSYYLGMINFVYENSVNNQRGREGSEKNFEAENGWGKHITKCIVEKDENYYLQFKLEKKLEVEYYKGNKKLEFCELEPFMPKISENKKQDLDSPIIVMRPKFDNILEFTVNGETYQVIDKIAA